MKLKNNKILFTLLVALGCTMIVLNARAVDTLIKPYPTVGGITPHYGTTLPDLIKYIYLFAIGISGAVALLSILIGAIKYISAAGNPSKMGDAKDQIFSAIIGVVLLLSSYLILSTINPDLVTFSMSLTPIPPPIDDFSTKGYGCACSCCFTIDLFNTGCGGWKYPSSGYTDCRALDQNTAANQCADSCNNSCSSGLNAIIYKAYYKLTVCNL